MKKKRIVACLLTALTVLTVSSSLGGCYHIAFHEEYQQYDKVAYLEGESKKISFRGQTYRKVNLDESYSKGFTGNYYAFYDYNREMIGIDKEIGWLYKGCSPLWGTYEGDEEVIWLARDADLNWSVYLREDIELPTLENCVLDKAAVGHSIEGKPYVQLPENTYLWDIIDKDFAVDKFEMESQVGQMYFKVRDFEYLWTLYFTVYERRGELYFLEYQRYYYEGLWGAYRVKDEYQYAFKSLIRERSLKQDTQGGAQ